MASLPGTSAKASATRAMLPWREIYQGVYHSVGAGLTSFTADTPSVMQRVTALKIDLTQPGIAFRTTLGTGEGNGLTMHGTICDFVDDTPGVVLAINANLSGPPLCTDVIPPQQATSQLLGLAMNQGSVVCDPTLPAPCGTVSSGSALANVPSSSYCGCTALMIRKADGGGFTATIELATQADPPTLDGIWTAIAGSRNGQPGGGVPREPDGTQIPFLVSGGAIGSFDADTTFAGRTGVGVNEAGTLLYLVVVEGLEAPSGTYGATFLDLAHWMVDAGNNPDAASAGTASNGTCVWAAVSCDGGGSSVMAGLDPLTGRAVTFNIQYGDEDGAGNGTPGSQRCVGNFFGIIADPK